MKKYLALAALILFVLLTPHACLAQQSAYGQEVFTGARAGARIDADNSAYHQIAWDTSGAPGACLIALDYSTDGLVWYLGGTIPIADCTHSGQSVIASQTVRWVRMNVNTLSNATAVRATYTGYQTNPGPTGTVTSVFGRLNDVLAQNGDYNVAQITGAAPIFNAAFTGTTTVAQPPSNSNDNTVATTAWVLQHGGGGGGGNATGLTFNGTVIPLGTPAPTSGQCLLFNGTAIAGGACGTGGGGLAGLSSDGTTLTFSGSGGISALQFNSTGTGPFSLTSPVASGALPSPPASGNNALVSGTDGWYVSNNGAAFIGPLGVGGGGAAGVASFNSRTGAVFPQSGDYTVADVTGAAPSDSPTFTTSAHAPNPVAASDDTSVATTAWVRANAAGGSAIPIGHSAQAAACQATTTAGTQVTISSLNILANDTVLVFVASSVENLTATATDDGSNTYSVATQALGGASWGSRAILAAPVGAAHHATSITVTISGSSQFIACVATYVGVTGFGNIQGTNGSLGSPTFTISLNLQEPDNVMVSGISMRGTFTAAPTISPGTQLVAAVTGATAAVTLRLCENTQAAIGSISCGITAGTGYTFFGIAIELRGGATGPGGGPSAGGFPRVVKTMTQAFNAAASIPLTSLCSGTDCPAGLYRISKYLTVATPCTSGGSINITYQYTDTVGPQTVNLMASAMTLGYLNTAGGYSQVFYSTGAVQSYQTQNVNCTTGTAAGTIYFILERLE